LPSLDYTRARRTVGGLRAKKGERMEKNALNPIIMLGRGRVKKGEVRLIQGKRQHRGQATKAADPRQIEERQSGF